MRRKAASTSTTVAMTTTKSLWPRMGVFRVKMVPASEVPESAIFSGEMERWVEGLCGVEFKVKREKMWLKKMSGKWKK